MKEIGNDIKVITREICHEFGQKIDKDLKASVFEAFENADVTDEDGNNIKDNKLTGAEVSNFFEALGLELQQKFQNWFDGKIDVKNIIDSTQTSTTDGKKTEYDKDKYTQAIAAISADNIEDVLFNNGTILLGYDVMLQFLNPYFLDPENTNPRSRAEVVQDLTHLRDVLSEWCRKNGIDTTELDNTELNFNPTIEDYASGQSDNIAEDVILKYFWLMNDFVESRPYIEVMNRDHTEQMQAAIDQRYEQAVNNHEKLTTKHPKRTMRQAINSHLIKKFDKIAQKYAEDLENDPVFREDYEYKRGNCELTLNDSGNGQIDKLARQRTGNCWLLAGINALVHTPEGKAFLERNILKDEEKHIFAIHLQQAEDRQLPRPNGDGIYVFTEKEVLNIQHRNKGLVSGEGDIAAFALAIEAYMHDANLKPPEEVGRYYSDGYSLCGLYEMLTGVIAETGDNTDIGISNIDKTIKQAKKDPLNSFNELCELAESKTAAITLAYGAEHAVSVVGFDGECLLIEEPNYSTAIFEGKLKLVKKFPPTYRVSFKDYQKLFTGQSVFRWK